MVGTLHGTSRWGGFNANEKAEGQQKNSAKITRLINEGRLEPTSLQLTIKRLASTTHLKQDGGQAAWPRGREPVPQWMALNSQCAQPSSPGWRSLSGSSLFFPPKGALQTSPLFLECCEANCVRRKAAWSRPAKVQVNASARTPAAL